MKSSLVQRCVEVLQRSLVSCHQLPTNSLTEQEGFVTLELAVGGGGGGGGGGEGRGGGRGRGGEEEKEGGGEEEEEGEGEGRGSSLHTLSSQTYY